MKVLSLLLLLMSFVLLSEGTIMETSAIMKYLERNKADYSEREHLKDVLESIVNRFSELVDLDNDYEDSPVLESIRSNYAAYNLSIRDTSSGLNLNFLPESDLTEPALANFLFSAGSAMSFLSFRQSSGFVRDTLAWMQYIKEEAQKSVVCNGWLPTIHKDSETGLLLVATSGRTGDDTFPIINDMPIINVNCVDPALFAPLLARRSWRISNAAAKAAALKSRVEQGNISSSELRTLLAQKENHEVYKYLGVRTTFWSLFFRNEKYRMDAIIAAVPLPGTGTIHHYTLIEGRLHRAD